jgi:biotin transport system substrate-specific component
MLRAVTQQQSNQRQIRVAAIAVFVVLMAISAKISIPLEPVPFTLQVLVVLLSGMVLGWRDALITQVTYVGLIALGLPIDARGVGAAALFGATGGFLFGFMPAAAITGLLVERATSKTLWLRWIAGLVGVVVIYVFGASHLMLYTGMNLEKAFAAGVQPFIVLDMVKAILAAGLTETGRAFLKR